MDSIVRENGQKGNIMLVYVLIGDEGYEGTEVLGVYESHSQAVEAAREYTGDFECHGFLVETRVIGAPAEEGWDADFRERVVL
jgi:hypothetical protein